MTQITEVPPFVSEEGEISVLGAALQDNRAAKLVCEMKQSDFVYIQHQAIYVGICNLIRRDEPVDLITATKELTDIGAIESIGGTQYLMRLMSMVPTTANVKTYIQIVRDCTARRQIRNLGQALIKACGDATQAVDELREKTALRIREIKPSAEIPLISQQEALLTTYDKLSQEQAREAREGKTERIMTGISKLDERLGGLHGSKLVVIGARPSVGKSIFALNICVNAAKQGKRVLFISLEMGVDEIIERIMANESNVSLSEITSANLDTDSWTALARSMGRAHEYPIWYCTEADTVEKVRGAAFQMYEDGGLDLVCVDYMQLMNSTWSRSQKRAEQVSEISRGLKKLAQEMNIPVIALTQLNRNSEDSRSGKKREPTMAEARESGSIEQDANIFILLHQPDESELRDEFEKETWRNLKSKGLTMMRIIVDKNRQGTRGRSTIAFDGKHMRFLPITREEPAY